MTCLSGTAAEDYHQRHHSDENQYAHDYDGNEPPLKAEPLVSPEPIMVKLPCWLPFGSGDLRLHPFEFLFGEGVLAKRQETQQDHGRGKEAENRANPDI